MAKPALTSSQRIKELDARMPIPKLTRGYTDRVRAQYDRSVASHRALFDELAEDFVVQMQGRDGIPQQILDRSPASLDRIDEHVIDNDIRSGFKKSYLSDYLVPALGGYVARVCDLHLIQAASNRLSNLYWVWGSRHRDHALQTQGGLKTFHPFAAAEAAIESALPLATFYATARWFQGDQYLNSITILPRSSTLVPDRRAREEIASALGATFPNAHVRPRFYNFPKMFWLDREARHTVMCSFEVGYLVNRDGSGGERPRLDTKPAAEIEKLLGSEILVVETGYHVSWRDKPRSA